MLYCKPMTAKVSCLIFYVEQNIIIQSLEASDYKILSFSLFFYVLNNLPSIIIIIIIEITTHENNIYDFVLIISTFSK